MIAAVMFSWATDILTLVGSHFVLAQKIVYSRRHGFAEKDFS